LYPASRPLRTLKGSAQRAARNLFLAHAISVDGSSMRTVSSSARRYATVALHQSSDRCTQSSGHRMQRGDERTLTGFYSAPQCHRRVYSEATCAVGAIGVAGSHPASTKSLALQERVQPFLGATARGNRFQTWSSGAVGAAVGRAAAAPHSPSKAQGRAHSVGAGRRWRGSIRAGSHIITAKRHHIVSMAILLAGANQVFPLCTSRRVCPLV
jgi:hypothetical protein